MECETSVSEDSPLSQPETVPEPVDLTPTEEDIRNDFWFHIHPFFKLVKKEDKDGKKQYQCLTCLPAIKVVKGHKTSMSHLKSHIQRCHGSKFEEFKALSESVSNRGKKRPNPGSMFVPADKKQRTLTSWSGGAGGIPRISQEQHERNIVNMWVDCMLPIQVNMFKNCLLCTFSLHFCLKFEGGVKIVYYVHYYITLIFFRPLIAKQLSTLLLPLGGKHQAEGTL